MELQDSNEIYEDSDFEADNEATSRITRQPMHARQRTGHAWISEMLSLDKNQRKFQSLFHMSREHFTSLVSVLKERGLLVNTKNVTVEEQLSMTILAMTHNVGNEIIQELFQHSFRIVSRHFHKVLVALVKFAGEMVQPPSFEETPLQIKSNQKYYPFFANCIGVIDGTHVSASIPFAKQAPYRSRRKNEVTQNICAACSFDMCFTYLLAGWEGSANDDQLLQKSIHNPHFKFPNPPPGKYYLVDSEYTHMPGYMAPFKNVRYHPHNFRHVPRQPQGTEELFNFTHYSLRTVIERSLCVLKKRFPILKMMQPYSFKTQILIVIACSTIHNFIRKQTTSDWLFEKAERGELDDECEVDYSDSGSDSDSDNDEAMDIEDVKDDTQQQWEIYRKQIAEQIEEAYKDGG
ncbi:protein ALP1-like [Macadamia integrifolia]|uniref:protein ALP1-like n=1 Tax=Macadamia integrifolia TaxID=60698 RepID=UPI001C4FA484|nr:protein ALP1-like [Macadamia integrifolia]XP_042513911.1 protein ALP1-like [Macadamia integrifolia]